MKCVARVDARCYLIGANAAQKKKREKEIMWVLEKIHEWLHRP